MSASAPRAAVVSRKFVPAVLAPALALLAAPVAGQEDYRAADPDRPIRVEDAYPLKFREWEWQLGSRSVAAEAAAYDASLLLELKTGFALNWQGGIEVHPAWARSGGANRTGVQEFAGHLLFNLNQESPSLPALAVRADVFAPGLGELGREEPGGRLRGMLTMSAGRTRAHVNVARTWASRSDGGDFWSGGAAFDHPMGLFSKALLGDLYFEMPSGGGDTRVWAELGARFQLTNSAVLDAGLTSRIDQWADRRANLGIVLGISRTFGVPGLVRVPPYPEPSVQ